MSLYNMVNVWLLLISNINGFFIILQRQVLPLIQIGVVNNSCLQIIWAVSIKDCNAKTKVVSLSNSNSWYWRQSYASNSSLFVHFIFKSHLTLIPHWGYLNFCMRIVGQNWFATCSKLPWNYPTITSTSKVELIQIFWNRILQYSWIGLKILVIILDFLINFFLVHLNAFKFLKEIEWLEFFII